MKNVSYLGALIPIAMGTVAPAVCHAQATPGPAAQEARAASVVEEVVVTASKREQRLIDVPASVAVVSSEELQKRQISSLEDLSSAVPSLSFNNIGSNHYFAIRGISNIIGASPLFGLYVDEADATVGGIGATQLNPVTYDLERVEVLRGPQGTLYGEGSAGGTIRFITRNPDLEQVGMGGEATAMSTEHGGVGGRLNAVVNLPVVKDVFALRIVGTLEHDAGWIDQPAAGKKDINSQDLANLRIKALWQVTPDFTASAMAIVNRSHRGVDVSDSANPYQFTQVFGLTSSPRVDSDYELYNLTLTDDLGWAKLLNSSSYLRVSTPFANQSQVYPFAGLDQPGYAYYAPIETAHDRVFTDELRLSSAGSGPWQYTVGGFYRHFQDHVAFPVNYFGELAFPYSSDRQTIYDSVSAFVDTSYRLTDRLTVGAGVRYFHDHQKFTDFVANTHQQVDFNSTDPRFYADYKLTPHASLYASAAKGFRSGGFNKASQPAYDPESVWSYEAGAKGALLEGRLSADVAVFSSSYSGYQVFGIYNTTTGDNYVSNAGRARIQGVEWDLTARVTPHLRFDFRGDYVDAKFTEISPGNLSYLPGDKVDLVPPYQITVSGQYDFLISDKVTTLRLDYTQTGRETSRDRSIGDFYFGQSDVIRSLDFDASVDLTEKLQVGVFAQNLTNDQGFANPYNYIAAGIRPRPRTFGVRVSIPM